MTRNDIHGILGYDIDGYSRRASGHSPEPIRDAVWALTGADLAGTVVDIGAGGGGWTARLLSSGRCERVIAVDLYPSGVAISSDLAARWGSSIGPRRLELFSDSHSG